MKVVSSARISEKLRENMRGQFPEIEFYFFSNIKEVGTNIRDMEVLLTFGNDLTEEYIDEAKQLKWIMVLSAGVDQIPLRKVKERNILLTNARGISAKPMAEYSISMMLQINRKAKTLIEYESNKHWDKRVPMIELNSQTVAVIGAGAIGTEIARLAKAFEMKTIGVNRSGKEVQFFDEMHPFENVSLAVADADFVISVLPSTKETKNILDRQFFECMKKTAVFINIGRGETVQEEDLINILRNKTIAHAVLDVFEQEPLPADHPFWEMEEVTVTPHLSGLSAQYQPRALDIFMKNLKLYQKGNNQFYNVIDPERGY